MYTRLLAFNGETRVGRRAARYKTLNYSLPILGYIMTSYNTLGGAQRSGYGHRNQELEKCWIAWKD